jgi:hypothetical protein
LFRAYAERLRGAASIAAASPYGLAVPGALALSTFALWNGFPVLYFDSIDYLQRPADVLAGFGFVSEWASPPEAAVAGPSGPPAADDDGWAAGRSVYYGLTALFLSAAAGPAAIVFAQAYLLAAILALAWTRGLGGAPVGYALVVGLLSLASTAPAFVAIVLPDVLSGIAVLAAATSLVWWDRLRRLDRCVLVGACGFGALSHDSILALLLLGGSIACAAWLFARRGGRSAPFRLAAATPLLAGAAVGLAGTVLFHVVAVASTGQPPVRLPFLSARLATSELGRDHLARTCPGSGYALCRYQDRLHGTWIQFLFSADPDVGVLKSASAQDRRRIVQEQTAFAADLVVQSPMRAAALFTGAALKQARMMSLRDFRAADTAPYLLHRLQPSLREPLLRSRVYRDEASLHRASGFYTAAAIVSGLIAAGWIAAGAASGALNRVQLFAAALLAGAALNATVCGVLASPYDRFQARVAWLLPLAASALLLQAHGARQIQAGRRSVLLARVERS